MGVDWYSEVSNIRIFITIIQSQVYNFRVQINEFDFKRVQM